MSASATPTRHSAAVLLIECGDSLDFNQMPTSSAISLKLPCSQRAGMWVKRLGAIRALGSPFLAAKLSIRVPSHLQTLPNSRHKKLPLKVGVRGRGAKLFYPNLALRSESLLRLKNNPALKRTVCAT